jgi:hypothetical protein
VNKGKKRKGRGQQSRPGKYLAHCLLL